MILALLFAIRLGAVWLNIQGGNVGTKFKVLCFGKEMWFLIPTISYLYILIPVQSVLIIGNWYHFAGPMVLSPAESLVHEDYVATHCNPSKPDYML